MPYAELTDMHAYDHEGVLGVPFLKSFKKLRMDFRHMCLTASGVQPFHYRDIEQWINDGNLFCLDRNLDAISVVTDDVGCQMAEIFSLYGKNAPEELCEAIDELFSSDSNSREASTLNMMRLQALEDMGRWAEAGSHIRNMLDHGYYNPDTRDTLVARMNLYTTEMAHVQPLSINMGNQAAELQWLPEQDNRSLPAGEVTVNGRQAEFLFDPTEKYCVITDKAARRLKLHPFSKPYLWQGQTARLVVIPSLHLGAIEVNNLVCVVVPEKETAPGAGSRPVAPFRSPGARRQASGHAQRVALRRHAQRPHASGQRPPLRVGAQQSGRGARAEDNLHGQRPFCAP